MKSLKRGVRVLSLKIECFKEIHKPKMQLQNYLLSQLQKSMKTLPEVFDHAMNL